MSCDQNTFNELFSLLRKARNSLKYPSIRMVTTDKSKVQIFLAVKDYIGLKVDGVYQGKILDTGKFYWYPVSMDSIKQEIEAFCKIPTHAAKVNGQRYGHCCFCKQELTSPISIYNGYGPICADNYGLPWEPEPVAPVAPNSIINVL